MARIHHATAARAAKLNINLEVQGDQVVATRGKVLLARGLDAKSVLAEAEAEATKVANTTAAVHEATAQKPAPKAATQKPAKVKLTAEEADKLLDGDAPASKSVVKSRYRELYRPFNHTNGDDVGKRLTAAVINSDGSINRDKLRKVAELNGVWNGRYEDNNVGMARMNVGNRLRAKVRKGHVPVGM